MDNPTWIIKAEDIKNVEAEDFQRFCFQLLDFEVSRRHVQGRVGGPPPKYHHDKGMDLSVEIVKSPRYEKSEFTHALTEDAVTITCIACKSGDNWKAGLIGDAGKPAPVETVGSGGHFTMLTNRQAGEEIETNDILTKVPDSIGKSLGVSVEEIKPRIHFFDADDLAAFYAHHPINLDSQLRLMLKIPQLGGLLDFKQWRIKLQERPLPEFSPDEPRDRAIQQLLDVLTRKTDDGKAQVIWVYGPPGIGKSRLVFEATAKRSGVLPRVYVSSEYEYGKRAVKEYDVTSYNDVVLIVDECPPHEVDNLYSTFIARASGRNGTLILIGLQEGVSEPERLSGLHIKVQALEDPATQRLVERELGIGSGQQSELVRRVLNLSEGYPWFAVLLAQALRKDPRALPAGSDQWQAARLAIAGPCAEFGGDSNKWDSETRRRAKALLAVMLTQGIEWSRLDSSTENRYGQAVEVSWPDVKEAAHACWQRGILRQRQNWKYKYVTPKNLARLVSVYLLDAPWSLGKKIREHAPELREDLYRRLEAIEVPDLVLKKLAADEFCNMPEVDNPFDLLLHKPPGFLPLQFIAKWQPALTARWLHQIIESTAIEELRKRTDVRRDLVFALGHISHRREGFEDTEASLFRLAAAENENWANNATGVWSGLFLVAINLTRWKFDDRQNILSKRVKEGPLDFRLLALAGLVGATGTEGVGPSYCADDTIDGPWDLLTIGEIQQGKLKAWSLLCELTLDQTSAVASRAREIAIHNLRSTLYWRIGEYVFEMLSEIVEIWQAKELINLREELDSIKRYETSVLQEAANLQEAFCRLQTKTKAVDYHGRLFDVVGRWSPGDHMIETEPMDSYGERLEQYIERLDQKIAEEGLAPPMPLLNELEWLESDEAKRGEPFMIHVGILDSKRVLLEPLIERAKAGGCVKMMSAYLCGLARSGQEEVVDEVLRNWRDEPSLALHTLIVVCRVGLNDERINWLIEDLEAGNLDPNAVGCLAMTSCGQNAKAKAKKNLIETLAKYPDLTPQITALDLLNLLIERPASEIDSLETTLIALVSSLATQKLTGMSSYVWESGCELGLKRGRVKEIVKAAITAVGFAEDFGSDEHAWKVLKEAANLDPAEVWKAITPLIDVRDEKSYRIMLESQRCALVSQVPIDIIMDWVGSDTRRSIIVADMCSAHERPLNEIARWLIDKFGADSPAARVLVSRAYSTPNVVSSIAEFAKSQFENAKSWAEDSDPQVAQWGKERVGEFQAWYEAESAREEFEEREFH